MHTSLFAYGFRPFFLGAGFAALIYVPWWVGSVALGWELSTAWPPTLWHAHEMLFGFIMSAVAGFMLTAVPSWTGQKGFAGAPLIILTAVWITARLLIASSAAWPAIFVAIVDLAFIPLLAALLARPLLRAQNRNTPLLVVLGLLWLANLVFHLALMQHDASRALHAVLVGIDVMLILATVISGRIVPAFTASALRAQGYDDVVRSRAPLTVLAIAAMALVAAGDVFWPDSRISGLVALAAACVLTLRLLQWKTLRTLAQPIIWVLHLGYAWLPVGLALKAAALLTGAAVAAFWLHALTVGALTTLILAVMTRASLGHTGRPLVVDPLITLAYCLLTAAAAMRVFGLSALHLNYPVVIALATLLWTAAFALFLVVYTPILCRPRVDGKPG